MPNGQPYVAEITVNRDSEVPLHAQIAQPFIELIESGRIAPGTRLEDEVSMANRLKVSRPTARRAMETLTNRGLIIRRRGAGTQVTPMRAHRPMSLGSLNDELEKSGVDPSTSVLEWQVEPAAPGVANALNVPVGTEIVYARRLRMLRGEPLAIMQNWLSPSLAPTREELENHGLYACLRKLNVQVSAGYQQIGARQATAEEGRLLHEPPGAALLTLQRTAYDDQHRAVEFGVHVYRGSRYTYDQTVLA